MSVTIIAKKDLYIHNIIHIVKGKKYPVKKISSNFVEVINERGIYHTFRTKYDYGRNTGYEMQEVFDCESLMLARLAFK